MLKFRNLLVVITVVLTTFYTNTSNAATLPAGATSVLNQASLPGAENLAKSLQGKFKGSGDYYATPTLNVGKATGVFVLYKPKNSGGSYIFAAILGKTSLASLGVETGPLDQVGVASTVAIYSPKNLGNMDVKSWPDKLGQELKKLTPSARNTKLKIDKSLNVFLRLADGKSGEFPKLLNEVGLKLKNLTATIKLTKRNRKWTRSAKIMHWGSWNNPFGFRNTSFSDVSILLKQDPNKKKTVQAWGNFTLNKKSYFLWGGLTASPGRKPARAFGIGSKEITTKAMLDFADMLPQTKNLKLSRAADILPLEKVKIYNKKFKNYEPGIFPKNTSFTVFYAEPGMKVADTSRRGPIFAASGTAKILNWNASSYNANVDYRQGILIIKGKISSPKLEPLPMSDSGYHIHVNSKAPQHAQFQIHGDYTIQDVTLAGALLNINRNRISMVADLGCIPPMLKATLNVPIRAQIPTPQLSPSSCTKAIAKTIKKLATKVGHEIVGTGVTIGSAIGDTMGDAVRGISEIGSNKTKKNIGPGNSSIKLSSSAIMHSFFKKTLSGMKKTNTKKMNLSKVLSKELRLGAIPMNITVTQKSLTKMIEKVNCVADGRISFLHLQLESAKNQIIPSIKRALINTTEAELNFYPAFKKRSAEIARMSKGSSAFKRVRACAQ